MIHASAAPRIETWVSAMMFSPRETEKLVIYQVAELARRRRERGLKLNFPQSIALITEAPLEAARDGRSVAETIDLGNYGAGTHDGCCIRRRVVQGVRRRAAEWRRTSGHSVG